MKVVLDTNVIVSAAMTGGGTCVRIVDLMVDGDRLHSRTNNCGTVVSSD